MQCFTNNGIPGYTLAAVNRCRFYLKEVYLSDISTGDGFCIDSSTYNSQLNKCLSDTYDWPNQGKLGKMDWHK